MYAEFLDEARAKGHAPVDRAHVEGIRESARTWTELSGLLRAFASGEAADVAAPATKLVEAIAAAERRVFESLEAIG